MYTVKTLNLFRVEFAALLLAGHTVDAELRFKAAGLLTSRFFSESGSSEKLTTQEFRALVSDGTIVVEAGPVPGTTIAGWRFVVDQTNSYRIIKEAPPSGKIIRVWKGPKYEDVLDTKVADRLVNTTVTVAPWLVPTLDSSGVAPVWLSFCSGNYFLSRAKPLVEPLAITVNSVRDANVQVPATWFMATNTKGKFLEKAVYFTDGYSYSFSSNGLARTRNSPPYDVPVTNLIYEAVNWTNVAEVTVPKTFRLLHFAPKANGASATDLRLVARYEGICTNLSPDVAVTEVALTFPEKTQVIDRRVSRETPQISELPYVITNGHIPSLAELRKFDRYKAALERARATSRKRLVAYILLPAIVILPLLVLLYKRKAVQGE